MPKKGFLTLAFGPDKYVRMARGLARSMQHHGLRSPLGVVTDRPDSDLPEFDYTIPYDPDWGNGVSQKLHLDKYSPFEETLFVDSDCLFFGEPESLWPIYRECTGFGVLAWTYKSKGDEHPFVDDLDVALDALGIGRMPFFNGGIYYFDQSPVATRVFETARDLLSQRGALRLRSFRDSPVNEEPVLALAMEKEGVEALPFHGGRILNTGLSASLGSIDVTAGKSTYLKNGEPTSPLVLHFNTPGAQNGYVYRRELLRLALTRSRWPEELLTCLTGVEYSALWTRRKYRRLRNRVREHGFKGMIPARLLSEWA